MVTLDRSHSAGRLRAVRAGAGWVGSVVLVLLLAVAACARQPVDAPGDGPSGPMGVVHGTIRASGGPAPGSERPWSGVVVVTTDGHEVARQTVAAGAQFRFSLPPGSYRLSLGGDGPACQPQDVAVAAASDATVDLICQMR